MSEVLTVKEFREILKVKKLREVFKVKEFREVLKGVKPDVVVEIIIPAKDGGIYPPITSVKYNPNNAFGKRVEIKSDWL